jgi:hypothetical protein
MNEEIKKKDKVEKLIDYADDLRKISLTNAKLKEKIKVLIERIESLQLAMGRTFAELGRSRKEIEEEFVKESIYFDTPIFNPVNNYINSVERYMTEKQQEIGSLVSFISDILEYAELTKEKRVRIDDTGMSFDEKKAFEEEVLKHKRTYADENSTKVARQVSIKLLKDLIETDGQKNFFRMICEDNTELQLRVLEGEKDGEKRPVGRPKKA